MAFWRQYVPVARRRALAQKEMNKLRKQGQGIQPVELTGRTIARSFWGKGWCDHLESFSDYANRLPRGRTYVRNGSVCHLEIQAGCVEAIVSGSSLYKVRINIKKLASNTWKSIKAECSGQVGSMLELLQGKLSDQVMAIVTDRQKGLFPRPREIEIHCNCPDWARMCKHVAAVLYGVGSRLYDRPELLFLLRDVDAQELIAAEISLSFTDTGVTGDTLADDQLADIFGIDLDLETTPVEPSATARKRPRAARPAPAADDAPKLRPTGKSVARLRKQLGMSVGQFAEQLGVSPGSVYRWEASSGRLKLRARPLAALARLQRQKGR